MTITTISSRDFNQDVGKAKRAASDGPVVITDRGQPSHVLLSISQYQALTGGTANIGDLLGDRDAASVSFEVTRESQSTLRESEILA
ncbi:MAG: type II toxin-antitoxin system Phd/YefM family antitoxin [Chromatiales bacterium]|jgi:prevent-host-death family protein|nr:type II toxin-antitoxin system Phd/YefM family antitoxin [Chromatiales bacterium]